MANTLTITGTDANAVRLVLAFVKDYWQSDTDFSGIIIQNKVTSAAMLSTSQLASGTDLIDPAKLTDAQYTALQSNGTPSPAVIAWVDGKIIASLRGHIQNFERDRAIAATIISNWTMSG